MTLHTRLLFVAFAAGMVSACGSEPSGTSEAEGADSATYTVDPEDGERSASITTEDGTATMQTGENVSADLPGGFTIYPGAVIESVTNVNQADAKGSLVVMTSRDSPQSLTEFYKKQATDADISIELEMTVNGGTMIGGSNAGTGLTFSLNASPSETGSSAQLMVNRGLGQ
ncbi:hypothetical protein OAS19_00905 [Altererythrobacter sp.]|nr:hypothetical protein [Altererythrobacter sp.]